MHYRWLGLGVCLMGTLGCLNIARVEPLPGPSKLSAVHDSQVTTLLDADFEATMKAFPEWASTRGDRRYDTRLTDRSPAAISARRALARKRLESARLVDRNKLSSAAQLNLDLLIWELEDGLLGARFHPEHRPISQLSGPHISLPQLPGRLTFTTPKHRKDWLKRMKRIPALINQVIENMQAGLRAQNTPPQVVMGAVSEQVLSQAKAEFIEDPKQHRLYQPFTDLPDDDPMALEAQKVIATRIVPAFEQFGRFVRDDYVPNCRTTLAATAGYGGVEYYQYRLKHYTTLDITAEKIHEIGLGEVARIRGEMMEVIGRSDFPDKETLQGDALFTGFVDYLRKDPRFYYQSADEMMRDYGYVTKQMDAELPKLFGMLPRLPYGIREMPSFVAPNAPTAYYYEGSSKNGVSGTFMVNTYQLDQRPRYEMKALAYHEAMPGHHLQIALSQELEDKGIHRWRTLSGYTVFVEGWALYSERLGLEVGPDSERGFYADPYDDFGRLTYEMWRALRLVVDTGIHAFGWSRNRSIEYMLENSALTRKNIESEVDRYIVWPGQAVAYKIGELKIRELRAQAEAQLGERFDIRSFHDVVFGAGAIPLGVLESRVRHWIESLAKTAVSPQKTSSEQS